MATEINASDALAINLWVFRLGGLWVADIKNRMFRSIYNLYGFGVLLLLTLSYFSFEIVYLITIWGNLKAITEITYLLLTHVGTTVKLVNFLIYRNSIEELVANTRQRMFMPKNWSHRRILGSMISSAHRDNIIFIFMCFLTVMAWAIAPLLEKNEVRRFPMKIWFPFDTSSSPIFELAYVYQVLAIMITAWMTAMIDTFASILMGLAVAQLDMLRNDLSGLTDGVDEDSEEKIAASRKFRRVPKVRMAFRDGARRKLQNGVLAKEFRSCRQDDILHERIIACIEHHHAIVKFAGEIQDLFGIGILIQFGVSSIILCLTCFELTLISPASLQFYSMLLYQACILFQMYCYCWNGNGIILKTSDLMTAAFQCQWSDCSPNFKSSLRIVMCRMQRPMRLMVGGFFGLSLETFSMILRTAYSFYAVLQRVHGRVNAEENHS